MVRAEYEIGLIWQESVTADDIDLSNRMIGVSHALQNAARWLENGPTIG